MGSAAAERSFWRDRSALVTGGTGFVGSWLVKELLAAGAEVAVFARDVDPGSELVQSGDIREVALTVGALEDAAAVDRVVSEHRADTVFHLGAQTLVGVAERSPVATLEANVRGTYNVLEACRLHGSFVERVVVASSDKAYGPQPDLPYVEETPLQGRHIYEVSKSCADLISQAYHASYGLPLAITRFGNVYGGGDLNWSRIVPGTIRSLLAGERPVIRSDGNYVRDYVYVKDVVRAYLLLAERLDSASVRGQAFNFSPEAPKSVLDIVAAITTSIGREDLEPDICNEASAEIREQFLSAAKARSILGWSAAYELQDGLRETIEWYRTSLAAAA